MKLSSILGINARAIRFSSIANPLTAKKIADSKLATARILRKTKIPTPAILAKFRNPSEILDFKWEDLPSSFALKPSRGLGGEGIIVVKRRVKSTNLQIYKSTNEIAWITTQRKKITIEDLKLHVLDILEGAYSMGNYPDVAFIQEFVGRHKAFRKYAWRGTPDIRIIVFNKVPVMAMLRLPTKESQGRANLHQGAIGVGVDMATGITTKAIWHGEQIMFKPDTKIKLRGIKIPDWTKALTYAVEAQIASGLGYCGVDIVLHPEKGPMVLEINAQPGLTIQLANMAGLKKRLERVEDLDVRDAEHGVKIAKALFAGRFSDRVKAEEGIKTIKVLEEIKILDGSGEKALVGAKIDTGARGSSIDRKLARTLGLYRKKNILWYTKKVSALGRETRPVIPLTFWLAGRKIKTKASVSDRSSVKHKFLVGRADLSGFLINPEREK